MNENTNLMFYENSMDLTDESFISDLKTFDYFYEIFSRQGLLKKYDKHLDIGGQDACFGYLCNSLNITNSTLSIDPININEDKFKRNRSYFKFLFRNFLTKNLNPNRFTGKLGFVNKKTSIYNNLPILKTNKKLTTSTENIFKHKGKYDLITMNFSLEYFEPPKIFKKIYSLLNKNGILYIKCGYWWHMYTPSKIFSKNNPYLVQRYKKAKIINLLKKEKFNLKHFEDMYNYFHKGKFKPVIEDYLNFALKNNFEIFSAQRFIPNKVILDNIKKEATPVEINYKKIKKILGDIKKNKNNVTIEDLYTLSFSLILKKN